MKKRVIYLLLMLALKHDVSGQHAINDNNLTLLHNLENKYRTPCTKYETKKIKRSRVRFDKQLIKELNEIYHATLDFSGLNQLLAQKGFTSRIRNSKANLINDTITFEKVNQGYLDAYIRVIYDVNNQRLTSKTITLLTKTHFFCETKEWQSYSYIDFIYLKRFIRKIKIPLQIAWSNVELESK